MLDLLAEGAGVLKRAILRNAAVLRFRHRFRRAKEVSFYEAEGVGDRARHGGGGLLLRVRRNHDDEPDGNPVSHVSHHNKAAERRPYIASEIISVNSSAGQLDRIALHAARLRRPPSQRLRASRRPRARRSATAEFRACGKPPRSIARHPPRTHARFRSAVAPLRHSGQALRWLERAGATRANVNLHGVRQDGRTHGAVRGREHPADRGGEAVDRSPVRHLPAPALPADWPTTYRSRALDRARR